MQNLVTFTSPQVVFVLATSKKKLRKFYNLPHVFFTSTYPPSHHDAWAKDMHFDDKELFRALRGMISGLGLLVP